MKQLLVLIALAGLCLGACDAGGPPSAPVAPADAAEFAETTCTAFDEFLLAWGNPDAGKSDAWISFEQAIVRGELDVLERNGAEILEHLAAARTANARGATYPPGTAVNAEFEAILAALDRQVRTVLEAKGAPDVAAEAEAATVDVWTTHWPGYLRALVTLVRTSGIEMQNLPCPDGAAPAPG